MTHLAPGVTNAAVWRRISATSSYGVRPQLLASSDAVVAMLRARGMSRSSRISGISLSSSS